MKPLTRFVALAVLLVSTRLAGETVANGDDSSVPRAVEARLESCDQTLRDIEAVKRSIDASGSAGVTPSDDLKAHRMIGIARRIAVETATGPDLHAATSASLKEILVYAPKLIDALIQPNPSEAPGRLLADGTTRAATVIDSAALEAAAHALNIAVDGLELAASQQNAGDVGWKTGDAGKEAAEMIKGSADCMILTGRNAVLEQVIQSGLVILSETRAFDASQIGAVTTLAQQRDLTQAQREEAASDLRFIQESDERIESLRQVVETELKEPAPQPVQAGATTEGQQVETNAEAAQAAEPSAPEVEPPPSAEPEQSIAPGESDQTSTDQNSEPPPEATSSETETAPSDQPQIEQTDESLPSEPSMDQEEAPSTPDDQPDEETPAPNDQVEASPADVEADQAEVPPDESNADSSDPSASPQAPDPNRSDEPAVEPESPQPPPSDADAPQDEAPPQQPNPAPPSR